MLFSVYVAAVPRRCRRFFGGYGIIRGRCPRFEDAMRPDVPLIYETVSSASVKCPQRALNVNVE